MKKFDKLPFSKSPLQPTVAAPILQDDISFGLPCSIQFWEIVQFISIHIDSCVAVTFCFFFALINIF
jgi:hypothetical protein